MMNPDCGGDPDLEGRCTMCARRRRADTYPNGHSRLPLLYLLALILVGGALLLWVEFVTYAEVLR